MEKPFVQHRQRGDVLGGQDPPRSPCGLLGAGLTFSAPNSSGLPERGALFRQGHVSGTPGAEAEG